MTAVLRSTAVLAVAGGLVAGVVSLMGADRTDLVLDAYLVYLAALLALAAARVSSSAFPSPRGVVPALLRRRKPSTTRPDSLEAIEDIVALGQADNFDLHLRLRPLVREIAADGLATSVGIDLAAEPERVERQVAPATWDLLRPDRPRPQGAHQRGIDTASLSAVVADLERMLPS